MGTSTRTIRWASIKWGNSSMVDGLGSACSFVRYTMKLAIRATLTRHSDMKSGQIAQNGVLCGGAIVLTFDYNQQHAEGGVRGSTLMIATESHKATSRRTLRSLCTMEPTSTVRDCKIRLAMAPTLTQHAINAVAPDLFKNVVTPLAGVPTPKASTSRPATGATTTK